MAETTLIEWGRGVVLRRCFRGASNAIFGPDLLRRAAELGAAIGIDLYAFSDDEDEAT
jgi:hypothetical protein